LRAKLWSWRSIHIAFNHDFANYGPAAEADRRAIETLGAVLAGSDRPFIVTSGLARLASGRVASEDEMVDPAAMALPRKSEQDAMALASRGVRAMLIRLPPSTHGQGDHGFVPILVTHRAGKGRVSAYRRRSESLARRAPPFGEIAAVIGRRLGVPVVSKVTEEAKEHFGWFAQFVGFDVPASSALTRERLGWRPTQPGLLADLDQPYYFAT